MERYAEKQKYLMIYTREPVAGEYPAALAGSIHLAVSGDGRHFEPLNRNYGILFARGKVREDDTIAPKALRNPRCFRMADGRFAITATRTQEDGSPDTETDITLLWTTEDFITFREEEAEMLDGLKPDGRGDFDREIVPEALTAVSSGLADCSVTEVFATSSSCGAAQCSVIALEASVCDRAALHWGGIICVGVRVPAQITASLADEVRSVEAQAVYSDGSTAAKPVDWELDGVSFDREGTYRIRGRVRGAQYRFPLARGYGDPVIFPWEGRWYFIATNDNLNDIGLYLRVADEVPGLFAEGIQEHLFLGLDEEKGFVQTFWAPEFHVIGGELYILFAVSGTKWGPQCHLMKLKKGASLTDPEGWEQPVRVCRRDGSPLSEDGITLDMTYLNAAGRSYFVWSYRRNIGTAMDTGSMLFIAAADEREPWKLAGDPVLLSRPLYGWENMEGTINNEGPNAFVCGGKVYLTYSGGAANGYSYVVGLLTADETADLTDPAVWRKRETPVLSYYSVPGEFGPGHNSFFTDERRELMIAYHGETAIDSDLRSDGIRRVHFDIHGEPVFDLSAERDLDPALAQVELCVQVTETRTAKRG
ncbi:MAG: family 43 glycosylhydrolase [Eubacteriales bacterium]|nr:family 43 glycosylhydrolase [Eubacteriales bacterium]